jgi:hypothetical protein
MRALAIALLVVVCFGSLLFAYGLVIVKPRQRHKRIAELEAENQRLDNLLGRSPRTYERN